MVALPTEVTPPVKLALVTTVATLPIEVTPPVKLALVVTVPAVSPAAVPVMFVPTKAEGVPSAGVTSVGLVANTLAPVPVSSVSAAAKLAEEGVAKNAATFKPSPETPVLIGKPVPLVSVTDCGVPKIGVTRVGLLDNTTAIVPVEDVTPVPPLATGRVPLTCVAKPILPQLGAAPTPPEISALPTATSASLDSAVEVLAYRRSPIVYVVCPVPPRGAETAVKPVANEPAASAPVPVSPV